MRAKKFLMNWLVNPGIAVCLVSFFGGIAVVLLDLLLYLALSIELRLIEQFQSPGALVFGYLCAAFTLNIDAFARSDDGERFIR